MLHKQHPRSKYTFFFFFFGVKFVLFFARSAQNLINKGYFTIPEAAGI